MFCYQLLFRAGERLAFSDIGLYSPLFTSCGESLLDCVSGSSEPLVVVVGELLGRGQSCYLALIILLPSEITGVHYHVQLSIQKISLQKLCINVHLNAGPERLLDFMLLVTGSSFCLKTGFQCVAEADLALVAFLRQPSE